MKTGQIFWGIFFVVVGSLILLTKYDLLACDWDFIWDLWPLLLVFLGLMVITRKTIAKPVVSLLFGIFVGVLVFGLFYNIFYFGHYYDDDDFDYSRKEVYLEEYDDAEFAKLNCEAGAGNFKIKSITDYLVKGTARGAFADYNFHTYPRGNTTVVEFNLGHKSFSIFDGKIKNQLEIELNENPIWDMELNIGAAKASFDLTKFKIRDMDINTGATKVFLKLGDRYDETNLNVEMGAAAVEIYIPKSSGCQVTGKMFLISKSLPGFVKKSKRLYSTENYLSADKKIDIDIQGGISSLEIKRY